MYAAVQVILNFDFHNVADKIQKMTIHTAAIMKVRLFYREINK